jgi:lipoprotein-anchoring transpeptidase ErfK/SrfK
MTTVSLKRRATAVLGALAIGLLAGTAQAAQRAPFPFLFLPLPGQSDTDQVMSYAPQTVAPEEDAASLEQPSRFKRQIVSYDSREAPGTIVVDTANTYLYLVLGKGLAMRYGIGVGRDGFTWSGTQSITRKAEWPNWTPPADMLARQPYLPRFMAGGPGNPLGARAMYLGGTIYRIHGTNDPSTIGQRVSSGCIRLTNTDVADLYSRVTLGAKVVVLPGDRRTLASNTR